METLLEYLNRSSKKIIDYSEVTWNDLTNKERLFDWLSNHGYSEIDYIPDLIGPKFTKKYLPKGDKVFAKFHFLKKGGVGAASECKPGWTTRNNNYNAAIIYNGNPQSRFCIELCYYPRNIVSDERMYLCRLMSHFGLRISAIRGDDMKPEDETKILNYVKGDLIG